MEGENTELYEITGYYVIREIPSGEAPKDYKVTFSMSQDRELLVKAHDSLENEVRIEEA